MVNIESFGSITHNSDPSDPHCISFVPSNAPTSLKTSEMEDFRFSRPIKEERTFLVYEKNLYELSAHSPRYGSPVYR